MYTPGKDFRSDTVTQPTPAMRAAMAAAPIGDDVYRDDPTTNRLEERAAEILGKEAALFVSSGTMGNQLAIMSQTRRGDEVICGQNAHILIHEVGAATVLSGVTLRQAAFPDDLFRWREIEEVIRPRDIHEPPTALVCIENALSNGRVVPLVNMREIYAMAGRRHLPVHIDGARIFNAAAALGKPVRALTACADTVSCCLSKGLCAPVGSILAGPEEVIARARKYRKMLGGGMRQTGILAAAGLLALEEMPRRLPEDHARAKELAEILAASPLWDTAPAKTEINMVFAFYKGDAEALNRRLAAEGWLVNPPEKGVYRFVTHYGIENEDIAALSRLLTE